jgi:hypothetical protein
MAQWQLTEFALAPIRQYSRATALRILIQPGLEYESSNLSELIESNTRDLQLTSFHTNVIMDYTNTFIAMLGLQTVTFESWQSCGGFPSSKTPNSQRMCCHYVDYVVLRTLLQNDERLQWNYVFSGIHIILHIPTDNLYPYLKCDERDIIEDNLRRMDLSLIVCRDISSRTTFNCMPSENTDVYMESFFDTSEGYHISQLRRFLGKIAPAARRLVVCTVVSGILNHGEMFYKFFTDAVKKARRFGSSFQLQHLQNSVPLNSIYVSPKHIPLTGTKRRLLDARILQPLSPLKTLTSITIDMSYCNYSVNSLEYQVA